jgi:hypothetical protein
MIRPNGEKFVGEYQDDRRTAPGTHAYPSGLRFTADFRNGESYGQESLKWPDGATYAGAFKDGSRHGHGVQAWDGRQYVGEFRDDENQGPGNLCSPVGSVLRSGLWEDGQLAQALPLDPTKFPFDTQPKLALAIAGEPEITVPARPAAEIVVEQREGVNQPRVFSQAIGPPPHALIIGNATYPGSAQLNNPTNDATA